VTLFYLVAPAGMPNLGDELIAATWLRYLAKARPDAEVVLDCIKPAQAAKYLAGLHPKARFTSTLWTLCMRNWGKSAPLTAAAVQEAAGAVTGRFAEGLAELAAADTVHMVGGGYVNALFPHLVGLLSGITARACGRMVMTGQGLCPPPEDAVDLVRGLVNRFDVVDVRDLPSAEFADAECTGDDVYLGLDPETTPGVPEVMISVQSLLTDTPPERLVAYLAETMDSWGVASAGLLECTPADTELLDVVERKLTIERRYGVTEVLRDGFPARPGQAWISTRFHPHLLAAAAGASGIALSLNAGYYGTKHRSLIEAGSHWTLSEDLSVPARPAGGGYPADRLAELRRVKSGLADAIYQP
jgi:Polysaccharide pyruvyl transferase